MSRDHPIFRTPLFSDPMIYENLKDKVHCRLSVKGDSVQASGIPPHVYILMSQKDIIKNHKTILSQINSSREMTIQGIKEFLEEQAVGLNNVTYQGLEETIVRCVQNMKFVQRIEEITSVHNRGIVEVENDTSEIEWQQHLIRMPTEFSLPQGSVLEAWQHWCCGNRKLGYPPHKFIQAKHLPKGNTRKQLSDYRFLMMRIVDKARQLKIYKNKMTMKEANEIFELCKDVVEVSKCTGRSRKRRRDQLGWRSVVNIIRKSRRQK